MNSELSEDPQRDRLRQRLEDLHNLATKATAWREPLRPPPDPADGEAPAPRPPGLAGPDLEFLALAREELLGLAELGLRLLDLHQARDAGGITSDAARPILRCRSCMWRWPCPTFRAISESVDSPWWDRRDDAGPSVVSWVPETA
ncbi:hypothetical protein Misp01_49580 [Microtetraspora sp. NBRC 13810]|uniref:hypothetical protein n=1 Tax=Microtetraspora sp. NBRC 13810 TaxID=3030990 RepID=UPI0024A5693B|nr:hypothetical protein [Microtetraspora sp. NBRC 13810]GLW09829.1 hypothetical protein Misp01_49580 [Microtetraspora sp. NBRC 13810]